MRRNSPLIHAEMVKRKWFSGVVHEMKKLGHIAIKGDIQVSKSWALSQNLSEFKNNSIRANMGSLYTYFMKVRKRGKLSDTI